MATMTNTPIISEAAIDLILQILEDRIDDLIVRALSRDTVIERLKEEPKLKTLIRIITAEIKKEKGGKNHPIYSLIPVDTRNSAFFRNPLLETSVGYIEWMKELKIQLPNGLTDEDWQGAATLASAHFCTKRHDVKVACIKGAYAHKWKKDGAPVATKDLPAHLETELGKEQLNEFVTIKLMKATVSDFYKPPAAIVKLASEHLVSCAPFETLEQAQELLKKQTKAEKNKETLNAINGVYEKAKTAREGPAVPSEPNNTSDMRSSLSSSNNNNLVTPLPIVAPSAQRQRSSVSHPTINFVGTAPSLRVNLEARTPSSVSVATPPEICNNTNVFTEEPTIDDELDAIDLAAVVEETVAVRVERPKRGRPAKSKTAPQGNEPEKSSAKKKKTTTKTKKTTEKTTEKDTATKNNKRKAIEEPLVDPRAAKKNKAGST